MGNCLQVRQFILVIQSYQIDDNTHLDRFFVLLYHVRQLLSNNIFYNLSIYAIFVDIINLSIKELTDGH